MNRTSGTPWFEVIIPGVMLAATGVGAGDLITASLGGSAVGVGILWAVLLGAVLKWFLTEGIARWQTGSGTTLLQGWVQHLGGWIRWVFLIYLLIWMFFTGGALMSACGIAGTAILPLGDPGTSKVIWGLVHSAAGALFVLWGGFRVFERFMSVCVAFMFAAVLLTALLSRPDWVAVGRGLVVPQLPAQGQAWVLGILGGVGGTVTMLSYGYWVREQQRQGTAGLRICRMDLAVGYALTGLFGIAMVIIGSGLKLQKGPLVAVELAGQLQDAIGPAGRWIFLAGFWGAVFSSLLGVWQSIPYLLSDFLHLNRGGDAGGEPLDFKRTLSYRLCVVGLAVVPIPMLWISVRSVQLAYALQGALFMPLLAVTLLLLNNRRDWVGPGHRNGWAVNGVLVATLLLFCYLGVRTAHELIKTLLEAA